MMASSAAEAEIRFDGASRTSNSDQNVPVGGVPRALREAAESFGLDPLPQLYNEALGYATDGHLRLARERLHMLLCMAPDDGEARLLLAKVYVAGQRWTDALAALDEAENCGQGVPLELRETVEHHVRTRNADTDEHRAALAARERGEIKALRAEARRLRSENAQMNATVYQLEKETRKWAWTTAGVSTLAIVFILANLVFGSNNDAPASVVSVETDTPAAAPAVPVRGANPAAPDRSKAPAAADDASIASRAAAALGDLDDLEGTHLEVVIDGGRAQLVGQVISARQRQIAARSLSRVEGITEVQTDRVEILARTRGTVHTVAAGDTFSHIAQQYYGSVALTKPIARANPGSRTLHIGDELKIPPVD
ncbi:MAG: BON domain-containing protein [Myxococcota bacterium]